MTTINASACFLSCAEDGGLVDNAEHGLFVSDTRFLSRWKLSLGEHVINLLGEQRSHFSRCRWDLLAPGVAVSANGIVSEVSITLHRAIAEHQLHEDVVIEHFGASRVRLPLRIEVDSDFADLLQMRQQRWERRHIETAYTGKALRRVYLGEAGFFRSLITEVHAPGPVAWDGSALGCELELAPGQRWHACLQHLLLDEVELEVTPMECPLRAGVEDSARPSRPARLRLGDGDGPAAWSGIQAADPRLQSAVRQARADLESLCLRTPTRQVYPAAGIPWFATLFGRDSLICSLQTMLLGRDFAIGTLEELARLQARVIDPFRDAEPGKICHEMRHGEWAVTGRVPHHPYYGSADSTALFLMLLGELHRWHGDAGGLRRFQTASERCLDWIDVFGDVDGDGFQEYGPREESGYPNQCWRDSQDGVPDETGATPPHPIATCELQGYVYAAKLAIAPLFEAWGDRGRATRLRREAARLKVRFNRAFWAEELGMIPLCLDGHKRQITSLSSNPGHCLWTGVVDAGHHLAVADSLLSPRLFSGFGIRTLDSDHAVYDPHSYHRGSVWPHDTVIAAAGLHVNGQADHAWRVIDGLLAATSLMPHRQLPELFSGLDRRASPVPVPYWGANVPQAWAAGSVIHAVSVLLGIQPDVPAGRLHLAGALPRWCPSLRLTGLRLGESRLDLHLRRSGESVDVELRTRSGPTPEIVLGPRPA